MRDSLQGWINDADKLRHLNHFSVAQMPDLLSRVRTHLDDYYISLVGELFQSFRGQEPSNSDWAQLGNAFLQFATDLSEQQLNGIGISKDDPALFSAVAFYCGDFPASACLAMRRSARPQENRGSRAACYDFLARPSRYSSPEVIGLLRDLTSGSMDRVEAVIEAAAEKVSAELKVGYEEWIPSALFYRLLLRFRDSNIRAILPQGSSDFWTPLVQSLVDRRPSTWEFFPSQIQAIQCGLLNVEETFSLQMPTGAGKTTLCETLLYWHLKSRPEGVAIMVVPYRSLASELRGSLVRNLNAMGLAARCAYGGTVPTGEEVRGLNQIRVIVATPESLSGILGADPDFARRISLVICDEGHLLDSAGRGIGLELLLARLRGRGLARPKFVFISAIVPNIEEINAWLGGRDQTVVRSTYRPAIAEFSVLRSRGLGNARSIKLDMHPHEQDGRQYSIEGFLDRDAFQYLNARTGRRNTYDFSSIKTQAVAAARKVLGMGATAIFAANKRGNQGAVGIAEELMAQLSVPIALSRPIDLANRDKVQKCVEYLNAEFGVDWIGSRTASVGAVLHHGDIPQEAREVLERLVRDGDVSLVICTSTLAEGVNLPIRTLVLYSVQRRRAGGAIDSMLARDIKNLVGRAGRAGANTKGLVICANPEQWPLVEAVAAQGAGEPVEGALRYLISGIHRYLAANNIGISNEFLEQYPEILPLIDGVDSTLIELLSEEIGEEEFVRVATELAAETFAVRHLDANESATLRSVFELRARRLVALRPAGRIAWVRETGAKIRLLDSVEQRLLPSRVNWQDPVDPQSEELRVAILEWAWSSAELKYDVANAFRLEPTDDVEVVKNQFFRAVEMWMGGATFLQIARDSGAEMDDLLAIHSHAIAYALQTLVEQGVSLLACRLASEGLGLNDGVTEFTEQLRFGAPSRSARVLATGGVRHRKAFVSLGRALEANNAVFDAATVKASALESLRRYPDQWRRELGEMVFENTLADLTA